MNEQTDSDSDSNYFEDPDDEDNNELAADQLAADPINPDLYAFARRLMKSAPLKKAFRIRERLRLGHRRRSRHSRQRSKNT